MHKLDIIMVLCAKSIRQINRNSSHRILLISSILTTLFVILLLWLESSNKLYGEETGFDKISASIECAFSTVSLEHCKPVLETENTNNLLIRDVRNFSISSLLLQFMSTGLSIPLSAPSKVDFLKTLISSGLRAHPILDLNDFIRLSDRLNKISKNIEMFQPLSQLLTDPRHQSLIFAPDNCWTRGLIKYLSETCEECPSIPLKIIESISEANKLISQEDVWAVVIIEPSTLFWPICPSDGSFSQPTPSEEDVDDGSSNINDVKTEFRMKQGSRMLRTDDTLPTDDYMAGLNGRPPGPFVTIRLDAHKVPDTRNNRFNPSESHPPRPLPDMLMYSLSGFLSLQLEIQNYLASGAELHTNIFRNVTTASRVSESPAGSRVESIVEGLRSVRSLFSEGGDEDDYLFDIVVPEAGGDEGDDLVSTDDVAWREAYNEWERMWSHLFDTDDYSSGDGDSFSPAQTQYSPFVYGSAGTMNVPLMLGALPTLSTAEIGFWRGYGGSLVVPMMLLLLVPSLLLADALLQDVGSGGSTTCKLSLLLSIGVSIDDVVTSLLLATLLLSLILGIPILILASLVVDLWSAWMLFSVLMLWSLICLPISIAFVPLIKRPDQLVYCVMSFVFIFMLPGYIYYHTASDVDRLFLTEMLVSFVPPSSVFLLLRRMAADLGIARSLSLFSVTHIAEVPTWVYFFWLVWDLGVVILVAQWLFEICYRVPRDDDDADVQGTEGQDDTEEYYQRVRFASDILRRKSRQYSHEEYVAGTVVKTIGVSIHYRVTKVGYYQTIPVLNDVNLKLNSGQTVCVMGRVGSGKSTLLRVLAGLDLHTKGSVVRYVSLTDNPMPTDPNTGSDQKRRTFGFCPQHFNCVGELTVMENMILVHTVLPGGRPPSGSWRNGGQLRSAVSAQVIRAFIMGAVSGVVVPLNALLSLVLGIETGANNLGTGTLSISARNEIKSLLQRLELWSLRRERVSNLPPSAIARLQVAMSLFGSPSVLMFDEPTGACDHASRLIIRREILQYRCSHPDAAIVIVTNDISDIELFGGHLWLVRNGSVSDISSISRFQGQGEVEGLRLTTFDSVSTQIVSSWLGESEMISWKPADDRSSTFNNNNNTEQLPSSSSDEDLSSSLQMGHGTASTSNNTKRKVSEIRTVCSWDVDRNKLASLRAAIAALEAHESQTSAGDQSQPGNLLEFSLRPVYDKPLRSLLYPTLEPDDDGEERASHKLKITGGGITSGGQSQASISSEWDELDYRDYNDHKNIFMRGLMQMSVVLKLRWRMMRSSSVMILLLVVIPLFVAFSVAVSCKDVAPPLLRLTGYELSSQGGVLVSMCPGGADSDSSGYDVLESLVSQMEQAEGFEWMVKTQQLCGEEIRSAAVGKGVGSIIPGRQGGYSPELGPFGVAGMPSYQGALVLRDVDSSFTEATLWMPLLVSEALYDDSIEEDNLGVEGSLKEKGRKLRQLSGGKGDDTFTGMSVVETKQFFQKMVLERCQEDWDASDDAVEPGDADDDLIQGIKDDRLGRKTNNTDVGSGLRRRKELRLKARMRWLRKIACTVGVSVSVTNKTTSSASGSRTLPYLVITSRVRVKSNALLLTNQTDAHAAPLYLLQFAQFGNVSEGELLYSGARYDLSSWPFLRWNSSVQGSGLDDIVNLQKGYIGANAIFLYMLLLSMACLGAVPLLYSSGMVTQLRLAGLSSMVFWLSNWVFDVSCVASSLIGIIIAVAVVKDPVISYFTGSIGLPLLITLLALYTTSVTAINLLLQVRSKTNTSTLVLNTAIPVSGSSRLLWTALSTIFFGHTLALFLARRQGFGHGIFGPIAELMRWISPSFALGECLYGSFHHRNSMYHRTATQTDAALFNTAQPSTDNGDREAETCERTAIILALQTVVFVVVMVLADQQWRQLLWCVKLVRRIMFALLHIFLSYVPTPVVRIFGGSTASTSSGYRRVIQADLDSGMELSTRSNYNNSSGGNSASVASGPAATGEADSVSLETQSVYNDGPLIGGVLVGDRATGGSGGVRVKGVQAEYGGRHVLKGGSATLYTGEHVMLGNWPGNPENGAEEIAQTALLEVLVGELTNSVGDVLVAGRRPGVQERIWRVGDGKIGYLPRQPGLLGFLTVREVLQLFGQLNSNSVEFEWSGFASESKPTPTGSFMSLLPRSLLSAPVESLSAGHRRILALQLACQPLATNAASVKARYLNLIVLLLDSPCEGLDYETFLQVRTIVMEQALNRSVVLSTMRPERWRVLSPLTWRLIDGVLRARKQIAGTGTMGSLSTMPGPHSKPQTDFLFSGRIYQVDILLAVTNEAGIRDHHQYPVVSASSTFDSVQETVVVDLLNDDNSVTKQEDESKSAVGGVPSAAKERPVVSTTAFHGIGLLSPRDRLRGGKVVAQGGVESVILALRGQLAEMGSSSSSKVTGADYVGGIFITEVFSERLVRLTCLRHLLPLSVLWTAVESLSKPKSFLGASDSGPSQTLSGLVQDMTVRTLTEEDEANLSGIGLSVPSAATKAMSPIPPPLNVGTSPRLWGGAGIEVRI